MQLWMVQEGVHHAYCICVLHTHGWRPAGVYKIRQVLMAQAVGADYVAPYLGRIADGIGKSYLANTSSESFSSPEEHQQEIKQAAMEAALDAVTAMQAGVTATGSQMRVLVASIRDASDISTLAARVS
jgi:transaldolase